MPFQMTFSVIIGARLNVCLETVVLHTQFCFHTNVCGNGHQYYMCHPYNNNIIIQNYMYLYMYQEYVYIYAHS